MKVLVLFSLNSGSKAILRKRNFIKKKLSYSLGNAEVIDRLSHSVEEAKGLLHQACIENYLSIVIVGGDGSWNLAINQVMKESYRPILGYLNGGTLGDCGKHLGVSKNLLHSLKIISPSHIKNIDIGKANDAYFSYFFAYGAYSDIPYLKAKKKGVLTYYFMAFENLFKKQNHSFVIDGKEVISPFVMALLGRHAAGFPISKKSSINDGLLDFYVTRQGRFNGLFHYVFAKNKMLKQTKRVSFTCDQTMDYCLDGERYELLGDVEVSVLPKALRVYSL